MTEEATLDLLLLWSGTSAGVLEPVKMDEAVFPEPPRFNAGRITWEAPLR
jgi:hypothetical protein